MMVNVIPRMTAVDEQRITDRWQNEGMTWREVQAAVAETQAPRYEIWRRFDLAEIRRYSQY